MRSKKIICVAIITAMSMSMTGCGLLKGVLNGQEQSPGDTTVTETEDYSSNPTADSSGYLTCTGKFYAEADCDLTGGSYIELTNSNDIWELHANIISKKVTQEFYGNGEWTSDGAFSFTANGTVVGALEFQKGLDGYMHSRLDFTSGIVIGDYRFSDSQAAVDYFNKAIKESEESKDNKNNTNKNNTNKNNNNKNNNNKNNNKKQNTNKNNKKTSSSSSVSWQQVSPYYGITILPYSDSMYYDKSVLRTLSDVELAIARNEIYARHGYAFQSEVWQDFFGYTGGCSDSTAQSYFNKYEKENCSRIVSIESER